MKNKIIRSKRIGRWKSAKFAIFMILPTLICVLVVNIYPSIRAITLSLYDYTLIKVNKPFIGFKNYINLFSDEEFWIVLSNTLFWTIVSLILCSLFGLGLALLLNRKYWGRNLFRAIFLIPWITSPVVASFIWRWMYSENFSPINDVLVRLGLIQRPLSFLNSLSFAVGPFSLPMMSLIIVNLWKFYPFMMVIFLAGLQSIPEELYEAVIVDGGSSWQKFWYITLPLLKPVAIVAILLMGIWQFNSFDISYLVTQGGPFARTKLLTVYVYQVAFGETKFGHASSIGVIMLLIIVPFVVFYVRSVQKQIREEESKK